jgi:hypothetical protein
VCGKVHKPYCKSQRQKAQDSHVTEDVATKQMSGRAKRRMAAQIVAHLDELFVAEEISDCELDGFESCDDCTLDHEAFVGCDDYECLVSSSSNCYRDSCQDAAKVFHETWRCYL